MASCVHLLREEAVWYPRSPSKKRIPDAGPGLGDLTQHRGEVRRHKFDTKDNDDVKSEVIQGSGRVSLQSPARNLNPAPAGFRMKPRLHHSPRSRKLPP